MVGLVPYGYHDLVILVGSPASGKSWVTNQLEDSYIIIESDDFIGLPKFTYEDTLAKSTKENPKPTLGNSPFGLSAMMEYLTTKWKIKVTPIFIIENNEVLRERYHKRERRLLPQGHITRQQTYLQRAKELNAFYGTSTEVLAHLKARLLPLSNPAFTHKDNNDNCKQH